MTARNFQLDSVPSFLGWLEQELDRSGIDYFARNTIREWQGPEDPDNSVMIVGRFDLINQPPHSDPITRKPSDNNKQKSKNEKSKSQKICVEKAQSIIDSIPFPLAHVITPLPVRSDEDGLTRKLIIPRSHFAENRPPVYKNQRRNIVEKTLASSSEAGGRHPIPFGRWPILVVACRRSCATMPRVLSITSDRTHRVGLLSSLSCVCWIGGSSVVDQGSAPETMAQLVQLAAAGWIA